LLTGFRSTAVPGHDVQHDLKITSSAGDGRQRIASSQQIA